MSYKPPFQITSKILKLSQDIFKELGILSGSKLDIAPISVRRKNSIKTIQASLSIEGNILDLEQVTDVFEGRKVKGPKKDILEVRNAIELYKDLKQFNPLSQNDLLKAHKMLMTDLVSSAGQYRTGGVGIFKGKEVAHLPPSAKQVSGLMSDLFLFLKEETETPWVIKACIFYYELEFIHPFEDGNGRIGRLWQQLLLMKEDEIFEYMPVEELIRDNQEEYYGVLGNCDQAGDSTKFIEFSLEQIVRALQNYSKGTTLSTKDAPRRLHYASFKIEKKWFSRKDYQDIHRDISSATASRDLHFGVVNKILLYKGEKNQMLYKYV